MKATTIDAIDQELGSMNFEVPTKGYLLETIFEQSNTNIGYQIPNPDRKLSLLARPNGFQLTSSDGRQKRLDLALAYDDIITIQLLPSYSTHIKKSISFLYILLFAFVAYLIGGFFVPKEFFYFSALLGAILGGIISLANNKEYRRNLLIEYKDANTDNYLRLSVAKRDWVKAVDYFSNFCADKLAEVR